MSVINFFVNIAYNMAFFEYTLDHYGIIIAEL